MNRLIAWLIASVSAAATVAIIVSICSASGPMDLAIKLGGWSAMAYFAFGVWRLRKRDEEREAAEELKREIRRQKLKGRS